MTVLDEMQFELLPSEDAESGEPFGIGLPVSVDDGGFVPGATEWAIQDTESPTRGTTSYGRDRLLGPTWAWQLHVNESDIPSARATLSKFAAAWRAMHIRETPGAVIPLRYWLGGQARRIYGRPRRLDAPPDNLILGGFIPISVDFRAVDGFIYDDEPGVLTLGLSQGGSEGGFLFPTVFPTTTDPVGLTVAQAVVGGDAPTYPVVRFNGPVTNPQLISDAWTISLIGVNIPTGQYVDVDTRPWKLTAMLNGTSSVAGSLARRTRMVDMKLWPGRAELIYRGTSSSGSSTCEVRWNSAYHSF